MGEPQVVVIGGVVTEMGMGADAAIVARHLAARAGVTSPGTAAPASR